MCRWRPPPRVCFVGRGDPGGLATGRRASDTGNADLAALAKALETAADSRPIRQAV